MVLIQILANSLMLGSFYALVGVGFALVWGVMNVINMAHGSFLMLGAYATYYLASLGFDPLFALPVSAALMFMVGYGTQRLVINRIVRGPVWMTLIVTFGINMVLVNLAIVAFTANPRSVLTAYALISYDVFGVRIPLGKLIASLLAVCCTVGLYWLVARTKTGRALQATRMDPEAAEMMGVRTEQVYALAFGMGSALAAMGGSLLSMYSAFVPHIGLTYTAKAFAVCVLGGLGNMYAVIPGGLALAVLENLGAYVAGPSFQEFVGYAVLLGFLMLKPSGMFGKEYYA